MMRYVKTKSMNMKTANHNLEKDLTEAEGTAKRGDILSKGGLPARGCKPVLPQPPDKEPWRPGILCGWGRPERDLGRAADQELQAHLATAA